MHQQLPEKWGSDVLRDWGRPKVGRGWSSPPGPAHPVDDLAEQLLGHGGLLPVTALGAPTGKSGRRRFGDGPGGDRSSPKAHGMGLLSVV